MSVVENALRRVVDAMENDPEFRTAMQEDPNAAMAAKGLDEMSVDVRVVSDTEETCHVVFPPAPNADLEDEDLDSVHGGFGHFAACHAHERAAHDAAWDRLIARLRGGRSGPGGG